jgi:hypothetical protein
LIDGPDQAIDHVTRIATTLLRGLKTLLILKVFDCGYWPSTATAVAVLIDFPFQGFFGLSQSFFIVHRAFPNLTLYIQFNARSRKTKINPTFKTMIGQVTLTAPGLDIVRLVVAKIDLDFGIATTAF